MGRATQKMIEFASAIAEELGLDMPDEDNFNEVSEFIQIYQDDYYESKRF